MDHCNLKYWKHPQKLTCQQARWVQFLQNFNFKLGYLSGSSNPSDPLSHMPQFEQGKNDNEEVVVLPPNLFHTQRINQGHAMINGHEIEIQKKIRNGKEYEEKFRENVEKLKRNERVRDKENTWELENGLIIYNGKVLVLADEGIRTALIRLHHDIPEAGHPGQWKTLELLSQNY